MENIMDIRDTTLTTTLRGIIKQEIELALYVRDKEPSAEPFTDAQYEKIEDLIGQYIINNVTVNSDTLKVYNGTAWVEC
jgi:hypothetical protein